MLSHRRCHMRHHTGCHEDDVTVITRDVLCDETQHCTLKTSGGQWSFLQYWGSMVSHKGGQSSYFGGVNGPKLWGSMVSGVNGPVSTDSAANRIVLKFAESQFWNLPNISKTILSHTHYHVFICRIPIVMSSESSSLHLSDDETLLF